MLEFLSPLAVKYGPHLFYVFLGFAAFAFLFGFFRVAYQKVVGKPLPRTRVVLAAEIIVEMGWNIVGALSKLLVMMGRPPLIDPSRPLTGMPTATSSPTTARSGQSGRASVALLVMVVLAALLALACSAARSRVVDLDPTTPPRTAVACVRGAHRCNALVPEHCDTDEQDSTVTRWWPSTPPGADNRPAPCRVCVVDPGDGGVAHCAAVDGGAR